MAINAEKLIIDSIDRVVCLNTSTGALKWMIDEITQGSIENGAEVVYGTGKQGRRLSALDRNKTATINLTNGFVSGGVIGAQTGSEGVKASSTSKIKTPNVEVIVVAAGTTEATLEHIPVGTTGAEVKYVYILKDGAMDSTLEVDTTATVGKFKVTASDKKLTFASGQFTAETEILVVYDYEASEGTMYANDEDKFSSSGKIICDLTCRDVCDNDIIYHTKFVFPNAKVDGNFTLEFGDTPAVQSLVANAISSPCASSKRLWEWYIVE